MLDKVLSKYTVNDAISLEFKDRQFLAYKKLYELKVFSDADYLFLILQNALISYQLSGKGEDYHEEFCFEVGRVIGGQKRIGRSEENLGLEENGEERKVEQNRCNKKLEEKGIVEGKSNAMDFYSFFKNFLKDCKNNKRFVNIKFKRIQKVSSFYDNFSQNIEFYYKNMDKLAEDLAKIMDQKIDDKTIVFAVKLFSYGARNVFGYVEKFPSNLMIPIDSRLGNLYKLDTKNQGYTLKDIKVFYKNLSDKLNIPLLHLDVILWTKYDELVNLLK